MSDTKFQDMLRKCEGLLRKAESTDSEHEREAFLAKAAELMAKYSIDEHMLRDATLTGSKPTSTVFIVNPPYARAKLEMMVVLMDQFHCRGVFSELRGGKIRLTILGYEQDQEIVKFLYASLLLQEISAMWRSLKSTQKSWWDTGNVKMFKKSFLAGFPRGVRSQLEEIKRREETKVVGSALVLANVDQRVEDLMQEMFPRVKSGKSMSVHSGWFNEGFARGLEADLPQVKTGIGA